MNHESNPGLYRRYDLRCEPAVSAWHRKPTFSRFCKWPRLRDKSALKDLASFAQYGLNPQDLRDVAKWEEITRAEEWETDTAFGLQDSELVEATERRFVHRVTRCRYAELWREQGRPDIGYQVHCRCDAAWWDRPPWNPNVRFEQPKTLMQGDDCCLFVQYLPDSQ